jgi:intracellular multiplication protein IcmD
VNTHIPNQRFGFLSSLKVVWTTIWGLMLGFLYSGIALAQGNEATGIGKIAQNVTGSFEELGKLILGLAFLAGIGFVMAAIFKFKQHKDAPHQTPLGTPVAMLVIGVVLVFMTNLIAPAGSTIFGTSAKGGGFTGEEGLEALQPK